MSLFDVEGFVKQVKAEKTQEKLNDRTKSLLRFMVAELDLDKRWAAGLLEMCDVEPDLIRYLAGPVIVHRSAWMDIVPKWLFKAVVVDRLDRIYEEIATGDVGVLATPSEVTAYMIPATYEAPLGYRWTEAYLWASSETMIKHKRIRDGKSPWEVIGCQPIAYSSIKDEFERLARDIRADVVKAGLADGWGTTKRRKSQTQETEPEDDVSVEQPDLFSLAPADDDSEVGESSVPPVLQANLFDLFGNS
jgi:hypothetical protein